MTTAGAAFPSHGPEPVHWDNGGVHQDHGDVHQDHGDVAEGLGAYVLGAADPADDAVLERHIGRCPVCAAEAHAAGRVLEADPPDLDLFGKRTRGGTADNADNADGLTRLLDAALARRPAVTATAPYAAGYADRVAVTGRVLAEFADADWERPTVEGWTARELVGHLAAVDAIVAAALGAHVEPAPGSHETAASWTRRTHGAQRGWTADQVRQSWERTAAQVCDAVAAAREVVVIDVSGLPGAVADYLTDRAFETWIHSRDLARLVGVTVPDPSPSLLRTMADLALRGVQPLWLDAARPQGGALEVALTGSAGGRWLLSPDGVTDISDRPGTGQLTPVVKIVVPATDFCFLVADRIEVGAVAAAAEIHGDEQSARTLLAVAPALARP